MTRLDALPDKDRNTVAANKAYINTSDFIAASGQRQVNPYASSSDTRICGGTITGSAMLHASCAISHGKRMRIEEEHFGWFEKHRSIPLSVHRVIRRVDQRFKLSMTASNIVRMPISMTNEPSRRDVKCEGRLATTDAEGPGPR